MNVDSMPPEERERWEQLSAEQRAFVTEREPLWRRAHEIATQSPGIDVSDVYHVLVSWNQTPTERLGKALQRGRLLARSR